jgi:hypothetical protein
MRSPASSIAADEEYDLCARVYTFMRAALPRPELFVRLCADKRTVLARLATRDRINIAGAEDTALLDSYLDEWLASLPPDQVLELDAAQETVDYERSVGTVLARILD